MTSDAAQDELMAEVREWTQRRLALIEAIASVDPDTAHEFSCSTGRAIAETFGDRLKAARIPVPQQGDQAISMVLGLTWMQWPAKYVLIEREQLTAHGITGQMLAQMAPHATCPKCSQSGPHGRGELRCPECGRPLPSSQ